MKTATDIGFFSAKDVSTREGRFASELAKALDARGNIIRWGDFRVIRQAFERHWKCCLRDLMILELVAAWTADSGKALAEKGKE